MGEELTERQKKFTRTIASIAKAKQEDPMRDLVRKLQGQEGEKTKEEAVSHSNDQQQQGNDGKEESDKKSSAVQEKVQEEVSIVPEILDFLGKETISKVEDQTQVITDATLRAIALKQHKTASGKIEDLVFEALDLVTDKSVNEIVDTFADNIQETIQKSNAKRANLVELYEEYIRILFISEAVKKEREIFKEEDAILAFEEIQKKHLARSGFLSVPIELYSKHIDTLIENDAFAGKITQGAELYQDYLDNLAIINIFKEDFFNVF